MSAKTYKTVFGFLLTMIEKYTPFKTSRDSVEGVYNRRQISESLMTSGQPTEAQFRLISEEGYRSVINLAPHDAENALPDEAGLLQGLGVRYTHIPVDFKNPTDEDFQRFVDAISGASGEKLWVHCAANMRVSAFIYRYRCEILGEDRVEARQDLEAIWEPFGVWKEFVAVRQ